MGIERTISVTSKYLFHAGMGAKVVIDSAWTGTACKVRLTADGIDEFGSDMGISQKSTFWLALAQKLNQYLNRA
jgi:hypothetical protein